MRENLPYRAYANIATKRVSRVIYAHIYNVLRQVIDLWFDFFVSKFNEPKHGHTYYVPTRRGPLGIKDSNTFPSTKKGKRWGKNQGKKGLMYRASSPDEYPATVTGDFLEGLKFNLGSYNPDGHIIRITITSNAPYTEYLVESGRLLIQESKQDFWDILKPEIINKIKRRKLKA